jgi:hypothetical protein
MPGLKVGAEEELPEHGNYWDLGAEKFLSCEGYSKVLRILIHQNTNRGMDPIKFWPVLS